MGNYISSNREPSEALKKLYKFNTINLNLLKDNIFVELDKHIDYNLYKSYDVYINNILSFQKQLKDKISVSNQNKFKEINNFCIEIKTKYRNNYEKYSKQDNRRNDYKETINDFYNNNNPLQIFNLNNNFTMDELKISYRNLARKYHPDRPDGDGKKFKFITQAYLTLMEELKNKEESKPFNVLREDSMSYMRNSNGRKNIKLNGKFDDRLFNKIYEENKLYDVNDKGYGNWLQKTDDEKIEIDNSKVFSKNFNINVFNNIFKKKVNRNNELVKFNIPKEYNSSDTYLLGSEPDSYTGPVFSNIYDIKDAYSLPNINNIELKQNRNIKAERENMSFSDNDNKNYLNYVNYNLSEEERRIEGLRNIDKKIENNYNKINKRMLETAMFSK